MMLLETETPWNDTPVRSTGNIHDLFRSRLRSAEHLPASVTVYAEPAIDEAKVKGFLDDMAGQLALEFQAREARRKRFLALRLFQPDDLASFFAERRATQPWILYYSVHGGLGRAAERPDDVERYRGLVPCSTMKNHGTAWKRIGEARYLMWLVSARKEASDWDWDSDVGHESAHAAFAPIPLFLQRVHSATSSFLTSVATAEDLQPGHLARLAYMCTEISVIAVRGEKRDTETGLPVAESKDELFAFLRLSNELMPGFGFDKALAGFEHANGFVDVAESDAIFEIGGAAMRVVRHLSKLISSRSIPTKEWYKSLA
jgi:hypothetical protein